MAGVRVRFLSTRHHRGEAWSIGDERLVPVEFARSLLRDGTAVLCEGETLPAAAPERAAFDVPAGRDRGDPGGGA